MSEARGGEIRPHKGEGRRFVVDEEVWIELSEQSHEKDATAKGVWMVGHFDWNWITESVHASEVEALRIVNGRGYGEVHFLPFGVETSEASRRDYVIPPEVTNA